MTSISGLSTSLFSTLQRLSPEDQVEEELQSLLAAGEISTDDQEALSSALDAISSEMRSSAPEAGSPPPSKEEIQDKIDNLIEEQVEAGALSEEQASELSDLFQEVAQNAPAGPGGPQGGPPPGPPPSASGEESDQSSSESSINELLTTFLQQLQEDNATGYSSAGNLTSDASLLFSYTV